MNFNSECFNSYNGPLGDVKEEQMRTHFGMLEVCRVGRPLSGRTCVQRDGAEGRALRWTDGHKEEPPEPMPMDGVPRVASESRLACELLIPEFPNFGPNPPADEQSYCYQAGFRTSLGEFNAKQKENGFTRATTTKAVTPSESRFSDAEVCLPFESLDLECSCQVDKELENITRAHMRTASVRYEVLVKWDSKKSKQTWPSNMLLPQEYLAVKLSAKVFLGGLPIDASEGMLKWILRNYGVEKIELPGKTSKLEGKTNTVATKGYGYAKFRDVKCVKSLLNVCEPPGHLNKMELKRPLGGLYFPLDGHKKIQVIPWVTENGTYYAHPAKSDRDLERYPTVFIGNLHGLMTAKGIAVAMSETFGKVLYVGIDMDKQEYPIGSGRVTFATVQSYLNAVMASYLMIKTNQFDRTIQIDPYVVHAICQKCEKRIGRYFCRALSCHQYFCVSCWYKCHDSTCRDHIPLTKNGDVPAAIYRQMSSVSTRKS